MSISPFGKGRSGNNVEMVIFVPSTTKRNGKDVFIGTTRFNKRKKETATFLSKNFGGSTRIKASGGFINPRKQLVVEQVAVVQSFAKVKDYMRARTKILAFLQRKKRLWKQDSMGYYFNVEDKNEGLHFI